MGLGEFNIVKQQKNQHQKEKLIYRKSAPDKVICKQTKHRGGVDLPTQIHLNVVKCLQEAEASVVSVDLLTADAPLSCDLKRNSWAALFSLCV